VFEYYMLACVLHCYNILKIYYSLLSLTRFLRPRLGGGNGMEWKGMKRIILEYSSFLLFGSFNGGNRKFILLKLLNKGMK